MTEHPPAAALELIPEPGATPEAEPDTPPYGPTYDPITEAILAAAVFLTRLPIQFTATMTSDLFGRAMGWFPLIGAGLGLGAGIAFGLLGWLGLPPMLVATATVALLVATTGALHEDGLSDTADGLGGGRNREHKLEIMRDSRIGSYGTLALLFSVLLRVGALTALPSAWAAIKVLVVAGAVSRAAMVVHSHRQAPARRDGLSATLGRPAQGATLIALGIALALSLLLLGTKALVALVVAGIATAAMMRLAEHHLGGQTGDLLGATQQVVEIAVLLVLVGGR